MDSRDCPLSYQSVAKENKANKNSVMSYELLLTSDYEPYIGYENAYAKDDSGMVCLIACFKRKDGQKFPLLGGSGNDV